VIQPQDFINYIVSFSAFDQRTEISGSESVPKYINEFWTSRQRKASSLHEISYRACFKPQLPRFFIESLTSPGDIVFDPFSGRGTTVLEAALLNRVIISNDINPLSEILARPRLAPPELEDVEKRLSEIPRSDEIMSDLDLSMFYEENTLQEILSMRKYLYERKEAGQEDEIDRWIRMVSTSRLTGHSPGFFSVYTMPPNQAVSAKRQVLINEKRNQTPSYRNTKEIICKKTKILIKSLSQSERENLKRVGEQSLFLTSDARELDMIPDNHIQLTVTSPPFLNVVNYSEDNWLRCWFNHLDADEIKVTMTRNLDEWVRIMSGVFKELFRITKPGGFVAFEVGEVLGGKLLLEEPVLEIGEAEGFLPMGVMINKQTFTKTSNIWGVNNNAKGTNTNRIVLFNKTNRTRQTLSL